ncbi:hypothetical protein AA18890_1739 [Komagataeibacter europaeus LMG 18890]|nr:hypothetical protein AA18890_1739 [Komagataeibacter europaeus LMG 18890]
MHMHSMVPVAAAMAALAVVAMVVDQDLAAGVVPAVRAVVPVAVAGAAARVVAGTVVPVAGVVARDGMVVRRLMYMTVMVTPFIPATMAIPMAGSWGAGGGVAGKAIPSCRSVTA